MKTGLLRETVGMIAMNIRVFDLATLEGLATLLGNEPGFIKMAIEDTIWERSDPDVAEAYATEYHYDGVTMVQDRESPCEACHANGLLQDLVTQIGELDPGTQKGLGPILNEIDMFLKANEFAFNENLDGTEGQDRDNYTDTQDREFYTTDGGE